MQSVRTPVRPTATRSTFRRIRRNGFTIRRVRNYQHTTVEQPTALCLINTPFTRSSKLLANVFKIHVLIAGRLLLYVTMDRRASSMFAGSLLDRVTPYNFGKVCHNALFRHGAICAESELSNGRAFVTVSSVRLFVCLSVVVRHGCIVAKR